MAYAVGPTTSVAVVACLLASVGFGGWRRATPSVSLTDKVPQHQPIDDADKPNSVLSAIANEDVQARQELPQHVARPRMRLPDGGFWTPHRAMLFRKTVQQCTRPAIEFLPNSPRALLPQSAQEQQQDVAGVTADEQNDSQDTPNTPAPGFAQANRLSQAFVDNLSAWSSTDSADKGGSWFQLMPAPFQQMATIIALAWIVDLLLVLPICFGCWFYLRHPHRRAMDSSRCSDDSEEIQKCGKAGKDADDEDARPMLQFLPSPSRRRKPAGVSSMHKLVEAAIGREDETTPRSQEASVSWGEPEPESSLELLGTNSAMEPFDEAEIGRAHV